MNKKNIKKRDFWKNFWKILGPSHKKFKTLFVIIVIYEFLALISPFILKNIIDEITDFKEGNLKILFILIFAFFLSEEFISLVNYIKNRLVFRNWFEIETYLHTRAQEKLVNLSLSYHEKENTGNKIIKIQNGIDKIIELTGNLSWEVIPTIVQLIITSTVLFIIDFRFGLSFAFFTPLFLFIVYKSNIKIYPLRKKRFKDYEKASGMMGQAIININAVKSFVQEKRETNEYKNLREGIKKRGLKEWFSLMKFWLVRDLMVDMGRVFVLLMAVYLVYKGASSLGTLVFVITLSEKSFFSLYRLSRFYDKVEEAAIAVERFDKMMNEDLSIKNPENGIKPKNILGKISFKNVSFAYDHNKNKALKNVNLEINAGCVSALIGPSGGGKTTIARMIYRHYDPQKGDVFIDNVNLKDYDLYGFRKFISIVPQEVDIFNMSIKDNIAYAKPKASLKEIKAAAKIANAEEFIDKLSDTYDTEVGERGVKLSGGQRQRIGIARAILANPSILIFDEATSNLDSYSESLIQEAMEKISKGRTVIVIAHRLSTIKRADKIIVLENGRVVEEGSHYELSRAKGGLYVKLLKLQEMGDVS